MPMTEAEWLACKTSRKLLAYVSEKESFRKLLLIACAGCRGFWHSTTDARTRDEVAAVERFADGTVRIQHVHDARISALSAWREIDPEKRLRVAERRNLKRLASAAIWLIDMATAERKDLAAYVL